MRRRRERGFTLVELMISLVLFSIVVAGILSVAVTMAGGFREQRSSGASESAARNTLDYIADAIRNGSPAVASGDIQVAAAGCPDAAEPIEVTNGEDAPDELTITYATGSVLTSTREIYGPGTTSLLVEDPDSLRAGDTLLITDLQRGVLVAIDEPVTSATLGLAPQGCSTLTFPDGGYPVRSLVIRAARARFYVDDLDGAPALWMDPDAEGPAQAEPLAEGIEDMQVALARDADDDGTIAEVGAAPNDDEWQGNVSGDDPLTGAIRAVRVTLVARAASVSRGMRIVRPAAEDRAAGTTPDQHVRRLLTTTVEIRNLRGSR